MCDFTEMTPYIAELRAAQTATPSPATASPSRDALDHPLDRAVVGDSSTQGTIA